MTKTNDTSEVEVPTPFGRVSVPKPELPELAPPKMDDRRAGAIRHAVASDIAGLIGTIPIVGDIIADVIEDLHSTEIRKILTDDELNEYHKQDKVAPSTVAMARAFVKLKE